MLKVVLGRNIVWGALIVLLVLFSVNWRLCLIERGKYLLGIYYNGYFQNEHDGAVYHDYLKTHGITHEFITNNI